MFKQDPEYQRRYKLENRDKVNADARRWQRTASLKKRGLTQISYEVLLKKQNYVCAICKKPNTTKKDWAIDHCHTTGQTRGILCLNCNMVLGHSKDDIQVLLNAIEYLKEYGS